MGTRPATTAEALMRSRYSALCVDAINYLLQTRHPSKRHLDSTPEIQATLQNTQWLKLEIISRTQGSTLDDQGTVTFRAFYKEGNETCILEECSHFLKENNRWFYLDGEHDPKHQQPDAKTDSKRRGRNDPCWCGSSKKFKKCHG